MKSVYHRLPTIDHICIPLWSRSTTSSASSSAASSATATSHTSSSSSHTTTSSTVGFSCSRSSLRLSLESCCSSNRPPLTTTSLRSLWLSSRHPRRVRHRIQALNAFQAHLADRTFWYPRYLRTSKCLPGEPIAFLH